MRVTNANLYRNYANAVNDVHSKLNKAMNKISSGAAYEAAADNPLAYYQGKKMDHQYQDTETKLQLMTDVKNRIYQQELGAREIQTTLTRVKTKDVEYILNGTNNTTSTTVGTIRSDMLQQQQSAVNALNAQYENFYIYGGNDLATSPFSMSSDGKTLTFNHVFPGEQDVTTVTLTMEQQPDGKYGFTLDPADKGLDIIRRSMTERGYVDIGYGTIHDTSTLLDTFTSGFSVLTGVNAAAAKDMSNDELLEALNNSSVGLIGKSIAATDQYLQDLEDGKEGALATYTDTLGEVMDDMTLAEHNISTIYSDLGNKYSLIDTTETRLKSLKDGLVEEYKDKLGADPYLAITELFSYQYSYNASLQLTSKLMESSLFNFVS